MPNTSDKKHFHGGLLQFFSNSFGLFIASHCETSVLGKLVRSKFCRIFSTAMQAGHYGGAGAPQAALLRVPNCITVYTILDSSTSAICAIARFKKCHHTTSAADNNCRRWNRSDCSFARCKFRHVCLPSHMAKNCVLITSGKRPPISA